MARQLTFLSIITLTSVFSAIFACATREAYRARHHELEPLNYGQSGGILTINHVHAHEYISEQRNQIYWCMPLVNDPFLYASSHNFAAKTEDEVKRELEWVGKFSYELSECMNWFSHSVHRILHRYGVLGEAAKIWLTAMRKYLKNAGSKGYFEILEGTNLRENGVLLQYLRDIIGRQPDDMNRFGSMISNLQHEDRDELIEQSLRRAYHAGDGVCNYLLAPPLQQLGRMIDAALEVESRIFANYKQVFNDQMADDKLNSYSLVQNLLLIEKKLPVQKIKLLTILNASQHVCRHFAENPTTQLVSHLRNTGVMLWEYAEPSDESEVLDDLIRDNEHEMNIEKSCDWLSLVRVKQMFTHFANFPDEHRDHVAARLNLLGDRFLDKCLSHLIVQIIEIENGRLWPPRFELVVTDLLTRIEKNLLRSQTETGSSYLELLDVHSWTLAKLYTPPGTSSNEASTSSSSSPVQEPTAFVGNSMGRDWLTHPGRFMNRHYDSNRRLVVGFANGGKICNQYNEHSPLGNNKEPLDSKYCMVELLMSMLSLPRFKLGLKNAATGYFYMWRLCNLNSLYAVAMNKTDFAQQMANQDPTKFKNQSVARWARENEHEDTLLADLDLGGESD